MDTADHLNNTKSYNIGEIALAEYLANNGYVREGQTGVWQSEVVEETTTKFKSVQRFKKAAWTMLDTLQNPDTIFLFGDNLLKK